jgi:DNA-binding transcriptional ArsR family regulator
VAHSIFPDGHVVNSRTSPPKAIEPVFDRCYLKVFTYLSNSYNISRMDAFEALADPTRRPIIEMLAERELPAGEIARRFDMTAPAVSQHLKILRNAELVRVRTEAQRRMYALEAGGLAAIDAWLARYRRFWS